MTGRAVAGKLTADVTVRRPAFTLDVSLEIEAGEVVAVLGPNGAGKSTLLGALAGLLRPDAGRIELEGRLLTDTDAGVAVPAHRRRVGLLAQQALLFPHLSVAANVAFGPRCAGAGRAAAAETARHWLEAVDAGELAGRRPAQLSGGQAQRVALARALAGDPRLLLLDEPLSALDVDVAPAMRSLLRRVLRGDGPGPARTVVLVTHHLLDAVVLADRVVVLSDGRVVEDGPARDVLTRPRSPFAARIAGLNLVTGTVCAGGLRTPDGTVVSGMSESAAEEGAPAVAVFPPSAVSVFRGRPEGSPRNVFAVTLASMEQHAEVVRMRAAAPPGGAAWLDTLAADVTPAAVADLAAEPGAPLWFAVKANEVGIHPAVR
ncbi:MAG TPA: ATP-binding cassette domain-containing protein [Pseudonocardia sp.]|nr:ATP-binding cassette domain-containing protein [Pseudonocardia sp.]